MKTLLFRYQKAIMATFVLTLMFAVPILSVQYAQADLASDITTRLNETDLQNELGGNDAGDLPKTIGNIITVALSFLGIVFIIFILYAGFQWLLAQGDEGKIKKAKQIIIQSVIAIVIIFLAYAITSFVFDTIIKEGITSPTS